MNRIRWLLLTIAVLALANGTYHWWRGRSLITIHCEDWTPSKVVKQIERQGGIVLKTNLPEDLKIRMHVDKVPVSEALETLATVVEARWRLAYIFAPTLPEAHAALAGLVAGQKPEGWKQLFIPLFMPVTEETGPAPDPRADQWIVKPADKPEFQAYAMQAAESVDAAFAFPESWNPAVTKAPSAGPIGKAAPALAKAAGGRVLEVFVVEKRARDFAGGPPRDGDGPPDRDGGSRFGSGRRGGDRSDADRDKMREAFAQRAQAEIDKLPADKRAVAQAEYDTRRKFFEGMRDLSPEERKAKMEEFMSNPANQDRMDQRMSDHMARMSPDQRVQRANTYVQRKEAIRNQGATR
jgi:hypothetical protein